MISRSDQFDLGRDHTRIKDPRDARRQEATVQVLLDRFFHHDPDQRWEIQVLADEVGMGKTFVALGTAYSLLRAMQDGLPENDLKNCYQRVLVITPTNSALFSKWRLEVSEFVKRCVETRFQNEAARWFAPNPVDRLDELIQALRRPGSGPQLIIANMGIFDGGRLLHLNVKRQFLLGLLFRFWGARFNHSRRRLLLKGAPEGWPSDGRLLLRMSTEEAVRLQFKSQELLNALKRLNAREACVEELLERCRNIGTPGFRGRREAFNEVAEGLTDVYRRLMRYLILKSLPLVIVDEAHNWKNGPAMGVNGYRRFKSLLNGRMRRVLLLTATPFQLRPSEMLKILKVGDLLRASPDRVESEIRHKRLRTHRELVVHPALDQAERSSRSFSRTWSRLPDHVTQGQIEAVWNSPEIVSCRHALSNKISRASGASEVDDEAMIQGATRDVEPVVRQLIREGLRLLIRNLVLSQVLGALVIRHRRQTDHRFVQVGDEYRHRLEELKHRPDQHILHASPGIDVRGDGELPHYLLMRCVSEMKGGKGRTALGNSLTGCYSTLMCGSEGQTIRKKLSESALGKLYLGLLGRMVNEKRDRKHPKVHEVVEATVRNWRHGEKTLIFCFRTNTAERLEAIIEDRIRKELNQRREHCMGGPESLKALRSRLTGRDRDLVVIGLDRVLWSIPWSPALASSSESELGLDDFRLRDEELEILAELSLRYRIDLLAERVDRVFLHRATEHILARRQIQKLNTTGPLADLLSRVAREDWIRGPYGLSPTTDHDSFGGDLAQFDDRGVHTLYSEESLPKLGEIEKVAEELKERRQRAKEKGQTSILDTYCEGPSLWAGSPPRLPLDSSFGGSDQAIERVLRSVHEQVHSLSWSEGEHDWEARRRVFQAMRRVVFRESVLLRLLPDRSEREESGWGELLVESFLKPLRNQQESMASRIAVFLEDLLSASGDIKDSRSARFALFDSTSLRDQRHVTLVSGRTDDRSRLRVFSGFNTPLLPEVLICTQVGQEGIDLHRHCRHVVHHDLAWNPAILEQRTGRVDRIGSKAFRERSLLSDGESSYLEVGVPFLAGTYDERMYEELRLRSQTFEVLTGGDLASDAEAADSDRGSEGKEAGVRYIPLPRKMVEELRVKLHVWIDKSCPPDTSV